MLKNKLKLTLALFPIKYSRFTCKNNPTVIVSNPVVSFLIISW